MTKYFFTFGRLEWVAVFIWLAVMLACAAYTLQHPPAPIPNTRPVVCGQDTEIPWTTR